MEVLQFGCYERLALQVLRQAYADLKSSSEETRRSAEEFFTDPDTEDPFSYRFIIERFGEFGYGFGRRPSMGVQHNPFRDEGRVYPEGENGQFCFHFALCLDPKPFLSFSERLERWLEFGNNEDGHQMTDADYEVEAA